MKARCENPRNKRYHRYGGRGITVCERWMDFMNFYADMGNCPPKLTLERKNNNGPYSPDNCVWATHAEQSQNTSRTKLTMEKAREIRALRLSGTTFRELAAKFCVSEGTIGFVLNGKQWKEPDRIGT